MSLAEISEALRPHGLMARGAFHPGPGDGAPPGAGTIVMIGNAGPAMWRAFDAARPKGLDPLNAWTRAALDPVAAQFNATAIYPFDGPPYTPFLAWAKRAEAIHDSPVGMAVHPVHGLWHAWRGALALPESLVLPPRDDAPSPCIGCVGQPCLSACPVDAFTGGGYDRAACARHLRSPEGADCRLRGCRARHACPVGQEFRYRPEQATLHMAAFLEGQTGVAIRAYAPSDAAAITALFFDSVHRATARDYTPEQRQAWAPGVPDPAEWHKRLARNQSFVAEADGALAGFAELESNGHIHMFFVHADRQRGGTGALLYQRVEQAARVQGLTRLTADVSLTARAFFERQGFAVEKRQHVARRGVILPNFAMAKALTR